MVLPLSHIYYIGCGAILVLSDQNVSGHGCQLIYTVSSLDSIMISIDAQTITQLSNETSLLYKSLAPNRQE
jgi:hypothetical protein